MTRSIAAAAALFLICGRSAAAASEEQALRQMDHTMWTARDGAPQAIRALAQGPDGTLWIGSEQGLFNFDGHRFRLFESPPGDPEFPTAPVESLLITKDGTLWVGFFQAGAARIKAGRVTVYDHAEKEPLSLVLHLREARDGSIWAVANRLHLIRFNRDGTWHLEAQPLTTSIRGLFVDASNTLWVVQGGLLYRRSLDQLSYTRTKALASDVFGSFGFAQTLDGLIWMTYIVPDSGRGRTQLIDQQGRVLSVLPFTALASSLAYTSDGSLIVLTRDEGVRRFSAQELSGKSGHHPQPDVLTRELGLSSDATAAALMDSHGNIWIGGTHGLDRLRPRQLTPFDATGDKTRWMVCATKHGELWIANSANRLYKVSRGLGTPVAGVEDIHTLSCADGDRAWFVDHNGVSAVASGTITRVPSIAGVRSTDIMRVIAAPDHTLYINVAGIVANGGGIWRYKDRQWTRLPDLGGSGPGGLNLYLDSQARLWTSYPRGRVMMHAGERAQLFSSGVPGLGWVWALLETSRGFFAAGNGLGVLRESQIVPLAFAERALVRGVRGMVESRTGDLWLNTASGIAHVPLAELEAGLANPSYPMKAVLISEGDYAGAAQSMTGFTETAARDSDGSLWFATRNGVVSLDPERSRTATPLPIVTIRSITADRRPLDDRALVGPGSRSLEIEYIGVNLSAPDNVTYRYRLEGYEQSWQEAGTRTTAIFTRLPPGTYTFDVMASNGDGRWTDPVSSRSFTILPSFYQTRWFAAAVTAAALLLLFAIHRVRVRQISRVMSARLDERLAERTRVARELHDTLLQTVHGSKLVADRALKNAADRDGLMRALEQLSTWLGQAAVEGRAALNSLRASTAESNDLAAALERAIDECRADTSAEIALAVTGRLRTLHPVVRDELYRVGYEAIRNASRHSRATRIEVTLDLRRDILLRVSDNGIGIDANVVEHDTPGHFGLRGMKERAERIGATFTLVSGRGSGTVVTVVVTPR